MSDTAAHCEAKLHGFRRTQDGVVVSFTIHPQEVPQALALDPLGTRYVLALAQIGDDEQPVSPAGPLNPEPKERTTSTADGSGPQTKPSMPAGEHKERRPWETLSPQQQAGILCADKGFQKWVSLRYLPAHGEECDAEDAAEWLRIELGIVSRKCLADQPAAIRRFNQIRAEFLEWAGRVPVAVR